MYLTGFADEAAADIDGQIVVTKELGWENIESRNIDGVSIHDMSDEAFDVVYGKLQDAGIKINCFGSAIANWAKQIDSSEDASIEETKRAIPRMKRLGTKLVRIMSYAVLEDRSPDDQMEKERFKRVSELVKMFCGEGLTPVHENCMNYGGMGWTYTLRLLENVPDLKLVFDTGNPVFSADRTKEPPYPRQSAWEFYDHVKDHIEYVHIKDGIWNEETETPTFTFPDEGKAEVSRIMTDLIGRGYDGGISIEPHMSVVFHDASTEAPTTDSYQNYVEYGHRMEAIIETIKGT